MKWIKFTPLFLVYVLNFSVCSAQMHHYRISSSDSSLNFKIRHFMSSVKGVFTDFKGDIWVDDDDYKNNKIDAQIEVRSIDVDSKHRNRHLKSDEFFDIDKYPLMTFESTLWMKNAAGQDVVHGSLIMKGVKQPVVLTLSQVEIAQDAFSCSANAEVDRSDWDFTHGMPILGKVVDVKLDIKASALN